MVRRVADVLLVVEFTGETIPAAVLDTATVADVVGYVEILLPPVLQAADVLAYVEYVGDGVAAATLDTPTAAGVLVYVEYTGGDVPVEEPPNMVYGPLAYVI